MIHPEVEWPVARATFREGVNRGLPPLRSQDQRSFVECPGHGAPRTGHNGGMVGIMLSVLSKPMFSVRVSVLPAEGIGHWAESPTARNNQRCRHLRRDQREGFRACCSIRPIGP